MCFGACQNISEKQNVFSRVISDHRASTQHIAAVHALPLHYQPQRSLYYLKAGAQYESCPVSMRGVCGWPQLEPLHTLCAVCPSLLHSGQEAKCRSWSCLMFKFNLVSFPKGSASRTALHRCKPSHPFLVWVKTIPSHTPNPPSPPFSLSLPSPALAEFVTGRSLPIRPSLTDPHAYMKLGKSPIFYLNSGFHIALETFSCPGFRCVTDGLHLWMWLYPQLQVNSHLQKRMWRNTVKDLSESF